MIGMPREPDPNLTPAEHAAAREIFELFGDRFCAGHNAPTMEELLRIASSHGCYPPEHVAEVAGRAALLVILGASGIGPRARWRDRLLRYFTALRERVTR